GPRTRSRRTHRRVRDIRQCAGRTRSGRCLMSLLVRFRVLADAKRRDERGSGIVEFVWLGIVLLVPMIWIVISVFEVQRGAFAVSSAARAASRAYALAPDEQTGLARAREVAEFTLKDQGGD